MKTSLFLATVLILLLFLRLPSTSITEIPLNVDEAGFAVLANFILNGQVIYRDVVDPFAPITPYFYAIIFSIFGKYNLVAVHVTLILLIFCVSIFLYFICTLIGNRRLGFIAAILFSIFSFTQSDNDMLFLETEWPAVVFCLIGAYLLLRYYYLREKKLFIFLSGLCFGLAFFSKHFSLIVYLSTLLFSCFIVYTKKNNIFHLIKILSLSIAGFLLVAAAFFFYFYIHKAFQDFWFCFWGIYSRYYVPAIPVALRIKTALLSLILKADQDSYFQVNFLLLILFYAAVTITALKTFKLFWTTKSIGKELPVDWYFICWFIFSYAALSYSGRNSAHYYVVALPALCLLGGKAILFFFSPFDFSIKFDNAKACIKPLARIFLVIFIILGIFFPLKKYSYRFNLDAWNRYIHKQRHTNMHSESFSVLVDYIKRNTNERDKIFVWGWYNEIYVYANRMPASRFTTCNFLTGLIPWTNLTEPDTSYAIIPGSWEKLMDDLKKNKPVYIIDTSPAGWGGYRKYPIERFPDLYNYIKDNYAEDRSIAYVKDDVAWLIFRLFKRR